MKKILVINCGSSSLKFQLYNVEGENYEVISKGIVERLRVQLALKRRHKVNG